MGTTLSGSSFSDLLLKEMREGHFETHSTAIHQLSEKKQHMLG